MTVFVYHEAHEDHEEYTIKLYRPLRFKPRGRYNLILTVEPAYGVEDFSLLCTLYAAWNPRRFYEGLGKGEGVLALVEIG